jgi:adenylate cyclase
MMKRKLAAILSAGAVEYGRLIGEDEVVSLQILNAHHQIMCSQVEKHQGRVADSPGGSLLGVFESVVVAVQCAIEIQEQLLVRNEALPAGGGIPFRIGVHLGEVTEEEGKILAMASRPPRCWRRWRVRGASAFPEVPISR